MTRMTEFEPKHFEMQVKDQIAVIRLNRQFDTKWKVSSESVVIQH